MGGGGGTLVAWWRHDIQVISARDRIDIVLQEQCLPQRIARQAMGVKGLLVEAQHPSAAEAVDQQQLIVGSKALSQVRFHRQPQLQGSGPHHPRQAATAQRRCPPRPPYVVATSQQQIGGGAAAELAPGVQQQGVVAALLRRFPPRLHRLTVGKGLATAQHTVAVAALQTTDDRADRLEVRLPGLQRQPEPMLPRQRRCDPALRG